MQNLEEARKYFELGMEHQKQNRFGDAEQMFLKSLDLAPGRPSTLINLSNVQARIGKPQEARKNIEAAAALETANATLLLQIGMACLQHGLNDLAAAKLRLAVEASPEMPQAHFALGVAQFNRREFQDAAASFTRVIGKKADYAPAYFNRGKALVELGSLDLANADFEKCIELKLANADFYIIHGNLLRLRGKLEEAVSSFDKAIEKNPQLAEAHSNRGNALSELGRSEEALASHDRALALKPNYAFGHFNKGNALAKLKRFEEALASYDRAIELQPENSEALAGRAKSLKELDRFDEALSDLDRAIALNPGFFAAHESRGNTLLELNRFDEALKCYDEAIALKPDYAAVYSSKGHALMQWGKIDDALTTFREALKHDPGNVSAISGICFFGKVDMKDPVVRLALELYGKNTLSRPERSALCFSLGQVYEQARDFERAFEYFSEANRLAREDITFNFEFETKWHNRIVGVLDSKYFERHQPSILKDETPIFIVGMPRSGTTLMEQMLSLHSKLYGIGESTALREALQTETRPRDIRYPEIMNKLGPAELEKLGHHYVQATKAITSGTTKPRTVDKLPHNFLYVGLIKQILPAAKVIYMRRHPLDIVTSIYCLQFGGGHPYAYDLDELSDYVLLTQRLMTHWMETLPGFVYEQDYSSLVSDPEGEIRKLLKFLDLEFEPACIAPQKAERRVKTASASQVRKAINKSSVERWRNYEKHFAGIRGKFGV